MPVSKRAHCGCCFMGGHEARIVAQRKLRGLERGGFMAALALLLQVIGRPAVSGPVTDRAGPGVGAPKAAQENRSTKPSLSYLKPGLPAAFRANTRDAAHEQRR